MVFVAYYEDFVSLFMLFADYFVYFFDKRTCKVQIFYIGLLDSVDCGLAYSMCPYGKPLAFFELVYAVYRIYSLLAEAVYHIVVVDDGSKGGYGRKLCLFI